ncbi:MAG: NifU family protein [Bacteroidetes bacterium]|nr:NifU family protein [Bacteroidota bacterium]
MENSVSEYSYSIEERIIGALQDIRKYLQEDGGDVEFVRFEVETRVAEIRLLGACKTCPMYMMTLRGGIERYLIAAVKEIRRVEPVS